MVRVPDFVAKDPGSIPDQGTKIPQATWCNWKKRKNVYRINSLAYTLHIMKIGK